MRTVFFIICMLLGTIKGYSQYDNICDAAYADFDNLIELFLQVPTEQTRNEEIYNHLEELQNIITKVSVSQDERYKLNSLQGDINVIKAFMSPVSKNIMLIFQVVIYKDYKQYLAKISHKQS